MTHNRSLITVLAASLSLTAAAAVLAPTFAQEPTAQTPTTSAMTTRFQLMNAYEVAKSDRRLSDFVKAVDMAGLRSMLTSKGPVTVIMPTNDAFKRMGVGAWEDLQKPENHEKLVTILKYHILPVQYTASDFGKLPNASTVGTMLPMSPIKVTNMGNLKFNGIGASPDVATANGVVYAVSTVLVPPTDPAHPATESSATP